LTLLFLGTFVISLFFSFVFTKIVRDVAARKGWLSAPANRRHLHSEAIPRLGGVAIVFSFLIATSIALIADRFFIHSVASFSLAPLKTILPPAILIFLLGVYDDRRDAGPLLKFSVQAIAGAMLFAGGLRIVAVPVLFGAHQFSFFTGLALTVLWVIAITNAFNLIDGLDGLAAGSALFSTLVVFVVALLGKMSLISVIAAALAGAIIGFLRYNFNPATIFLGDCGSLFIGFMLSALALFGSQKTPTIVAVAIPMVSFGLPILETSLSVLRRLISGRPVFAADREHIHHKLLQRGMSHRQVVIVLYGVSAIFALLSLFLLWPTGSTLGLVLAVLGTGIWIGVQHLGYLEFGELRRVALRTVEQPQIFINNLAIRRAAEELKDAADLQDLYRILSVAFEENDFDGFELRGEFESAAETAGVPQTASHPHVSWRKSGTQAQYAVGKTWSLHLDLVSTANLYCGTLVIFRRYAQRNLQVDVNLLTSIFATSLADALHKIAISQKSICVSDEDAAFLQARAG
jgi:UDP-GlcNAc:undecaprenyl-phosphate GlcNAc-1-phosphate transferase